MLRHISTKKMAMVISPFLAVLAVVTIAYTQGQEDKFPIIAYGGPRPHLADYFSQIKDCNFNAVFCWDDHDTGVVKNDFIVADTMEFHLITSLHRNATSAQWSKYESDEHADPPEVMEHFSHSSVLGREDYDEMFDLYAWVAEVSSDTAGWTQRGLLDDYNNEQEIPTYRYPYDTLMYYAHFRMRLDSNAVVLYPPLPLAKIDAIRIHNEDTTLMVEDSLWSDDFDTAGAFGQYANFTLSFQRARFDSGVMDYRVYWYDNTDLWVDRVTLEDARYDTLMAAGYNDSIRSKVDAFDDYDNALFRWYLEDEPRGDQFSANGYVRVFLDDSLGTVPGVQAVGAFPRRNPDYYQGFLDVVNPNELTFDFYPINAISDSATDTEVESLSLQRCWRGSVPEIRMAKQIAKNGGKRLWYYPQTFASYQYEDGYCEPWWCRYPTTNELKCNVWLGLCCGAQGLFYYRYASWVRKGPCGKGDPSDTLPPPQEGPMTIPSKGVDWISGLVEQKIEGAETTWVKVETYPGDTLWNAVRDMNAVVDSLGDLLLGLTWLDEGRWDKLSELSGSYIDSIRSDSFPQDSVWVEVGFFEDLDLCKYFMLVNRRCLSSETQTVTATLNLTQGECYTIKDMYSGDETVLFNQSGTVNFTTTLGPGEGKLFKLRQGAYLTTHHTWSDTDTIHCDITIAPSGTLTIQPGATLKFASGTKLIVEGALIAEGTEADQIAFTSAQASPDEGDWMWIEFSPGSENTNVLRYCIIEWASIGTWCNNASPTLDNNLIQHCSVAGIQCDQANPVITNNTVKWCEFGAEFNCSNPLLEGNIFSNNTIGIELSNSYSPVHIIKDNNFNNNDFYGVWLDGHSSPTIYRCEIKGNDDIGVMCINHCSPDMDSCRVQDNGSTGLYCSDHSSPILAYRPRAVGYPEHAYNWIILNGGCGVYAKLSSYPDLGSYHKSGYCPGNNCIHDNTSYEVVNDNSSDWIWAQYNYWGLPRSQHPDSSDFSGLVIWRDLQSPWVKEALPLPILLTRWRI